MQFSKKIIAFMTAAAMSVSMLSVSAFADNVNFYINWTNDKGNGPANGSTSGTNGKTNFKSTINCATGTIDVTWDTTKQNFNFIAGVGWSVGKASRKVGYNFGILEHTSGSTGCTYLDFYGWTRNSLIEYYVFENWFNYVPNDGTKVGTLISDGATYTYYYKNASGPNIDGNGPFKQVVSIRDSGAKRKAGTITFQNHVNAWNSNINTKLGTSWSYQAMCVEGYNSSGRANGCVWDAS